VSKPAMFRNGVRISERHGAGEWTLEKICLAILMPLGVWAVWSAFTLAGAGYGTVTAWFADRVNAGLMVLTSLVFFTFASLAWKVIVEDYIHKTGTRALLLGLLNLVFLALAAASVFFIVRLALGSAPLPAGFGA
jgi:succinate dehydrogenase / fumarate reductase membrane anchor subunit